MSGSAANARIVAGNWKMHMGPSRARAFVEAFRHPEGREQVEVLLFPPAVSLATLVDGLRGRGVQARLGVQNIHPEREGAFTGEISAEMAREAGARFILVGHSERRQIFGESPDDTARKIAAAFRAGLTPLLCVGETLVERQAGRLEEVLGRHLDAALSPRGIRDRIHDGERFLVAYEPVWAIGTGETATPADASGAHAFIRSRLESLLGDGASGIPILYGGSVKPANAAELLNAQGVDGVLVGGASLDPVSFAKIIDGAP
ncbi:MAG: triose-phosphate isomerase [Gemmatimonadales bacterium]|nr:MAG: triose-phosphate isomerase [Gemmatimonadales bacterium]